MKTTYFSNNGVLFFLRHNHQQGPHFPYPLRHCCIGVGRFRRFRRFPPPPPPPPHFTTSAAATEYNHHVSKPRRWISNVKSYCITDKSDVSIDEDDEKDRENTIQQLDDNLQDFIDSLWILKVYKSYGYMLPFILLSMLITTGLKAFLLALALPLGQSTFSYAIQKIQEDNSSSSSRISKRKQKTKTNYKNRPQTRSSENGNINKSAKKSWGPPIYDSNETADQNTNSYGGWDEL